MAVFLHTFACVFQIISDLRKRVVYMNQSKITFLFILSLLAMTRMIGQDTTVVVTGDGVDATVSTDSDPVAMWKSGKAKYPPKPKNMWEIGLHGGHYFIDGDVDPALPGYGFGLHIRKAVHYALSLRLDVGYDFAKDWILNLLVTIWRTNLKYLQATTLLILGFSIIRHNMVMV
ncbi:MAG: hypothetical protein IPM86_00770 [Saprospiraceae bacterium]|nr:hypothetical protein [Saprospiraceae bacterium]